MAEVKHGRGYVYSIQYHIVWCVKYRHKVLLGDIDIRLKEVLNQIATDNGFTISEIESDCDHVHLLVDCNPQHSDVGLKDFAILSNGEVFENPKFLRNMEQKLIREQRILSRRVKGSSNWNKQRVKVARIHDRIANARTDYLQKISMHIVKNHDIIAIEDLQVSNMMKNHKLAKAISEVSFLP